MTLTELLYQLYAAADQRAAALFVGALAIPGVLLLIGSVVRGNHAKTFFANLLGGYVVVVALLAAATAAIGVGVFGRPLLSANALLLLAPVLGLTAALLAQRALMPLGDVPLYGALGALTGATDKADAPAPSPGAPSRLASIAAFALVVTGVGIVSARLAVAPPPGSDAPVTLAIADITNETGEEDLDGLSGLLITSLGQSRRLEVMSRLTMFDVLRQLGRRQVARIDEGLARDICRRAGTSALAVASLRRFDRLYSLELSVMDVESGRILFTAQEKGEGKGEIPAMLDRVAERTRAGLSERASEISANRRSVTSLATASMDAYQRYFEAEQQFAAGDFEAAKEKLEAAVKADPRFGLAHFKLGYLSDFKVPGIDQQKHLEVAKAELERAPAREQLLMRGWLTQHEGRTAEAMALFERALAEFPPDKMAYYMSGDVRFHNGDAPGSIPFLEKALEIDPTFMPALNHLAYAYLNTNQLQKTLDVAQRAVARHPDFDTLVLLAQAQIALGQEQAAVASIDRAQAIGPPPLRDCFLPGFAVWSRLSTPDRMLVESERCLKAPPQPMLPVATRNTVIYLQTGQWRLAVKEAEKAERDPVPPGGGIKGKEGLFFEMRRGRIAMLSELGELEEARALITDLEARASTDDQRRGVIDAMLWADQPERARAYFNAHPVEDAEPWIASAEAGARKDWEAAVAALEPMLNGKPHQRQTALLRAAQLRIEQGTAEKALPLVQEVLAHNAVEFNPSRVSHLMRAVYFRGRALEASGDRAAARRDYQRVVDFWVRGDKDLPMLREARARLAAF